MKRLFVAVMGSLCVLSAYAQTPASVSGSCAAKAVGKNGKALAGASRTSFMKKCEQTACEAQAVSKNGKPLSGAAKNASIKKCMAS